MKIGRNAPCPCGSGAKYKKCCGRPGQARTDDPMASGDPDAIGSADVEQEELRAAKEAYYTQWVATPHPAFDNLTPLEAAELDQWRPALLDILCDFQDAEIYNDGSYEFFDLWHRLGVYEEMSESLEAWLEEDRDDESMLGRALRGVVQNQFALDSPPEVRETYARLVAEGVSHRAAIEAFMGELFPVVQAVMAGEESGDLPTYRKALGRLRARDLTSTR